MLEEMPLTDVVMKVEANQLEYFATQFLVGGVVTVALQNGGRGTCIS